MAPKCSAHLEVTERKTCLCLCWRDAGLQYGTWLRNFQGWFWTYGIFFSWSELEPGIHLSYYLLWLSCNSYRETEGECLMFFIIMCLLLLRNLKKKKQLSPSLAPFYLYLLCGYLSPYSRQSSSAGDSGILLIQRWQWGICGHRLHGKISHKHQQSNASRLYQTLYMKNTGALLENWWGTQIK